MWWTSVALAQSMTGAEYYLVALKHWEAGDVESARALAEKALSVEPTLPEARLLAAMARERESDAGALTELEAMAQDPSLRAPVRLMAAEVVSRHTERQRRDQVSVAVGWGLGFEARDSAWSPEGRVGAAVGVPVVENVRLRVDFSWDPFTTDTLSLTGPMGFVGAAWGLPIGKGVVAFEVGGELGIWYAQGPWWRDGSQMQVGARFFGGVDVRPWRNVGIMAEVGTSLWPTLMLDLDGVGEPLEARVLLKVWVGTPPLIKAVRSPSPS